MSWILWHRKKGPSLWEIWGDFQEKATAETWYRRFSEGMSNNSNAYQDVEAIRLTESLTLKERKR